MNTANGLERFGIAAFESGRKGPGAKEVDSF